MGRDSQYLSIVPQPSSSSHRTTCVFSYPSLKLGKTHRLGEGLPRQLLPACLVCLSVCLPNCIAFAGSLWGLLPCCVRKAVWWWWTPVHPISLALRAP